MADKIILVDTSILIDYYRKTDKNNSYWITLVRQGYSVAISAITRYEIYSGATAGQLSFWDAVLQAITVFPLDKVTVDTAVIINTTLKENENKLTLPICLLLQLPLTRTYRWRH